MNNNLHIRSYSCFFSRKSNQHLFAGLARCLMSVWTQIGQNKRVACSIKRSICRLRFEGSLHISYSKKKRRRRNEVDGRRLTLNKHIPRVGSTRLSTSLSSLRGLADTHGRNYNHRLARSTDFVGVKGGGGHFHHSATFL